MKIRKPWSNSVNGSLIANAVCPFTAHNQPAPKTLHMNENSNQTPSYPRSSAAQENGLKQGSELILMISGQHPCNNYTVHIRPHFARVPPLNLFACIMRNLNKRSWFINAVIYIYDQRAFVVQARCQRAQDLHCQSVGSLTGLSVDEWGPHRVRQEQDHSKYSIGVYISCSSHQSHLTRLPASNCKITMSWFSVML